jgi:uncharacterized membrane protein YbaN (DUF454 family)
MRFIWAGLGCVSLLCGLIGAVLPLIPTVPFVLLAAFLFARSSPKLHDWLIQHRTFGPAIINWQTHGAISPRAKGWATVSCLVVLLISTVVGIRPLIIGIQGLVMIGVMLFLWTRPNGPR